MTQRRNTMTKIRSSTDSLLRPDAAYASWAGRISRADLPERPTSSCYRPAPKVQPRSCARSTAQWFEGFGRVVFEAMASGLPVVCAVHGGYADYLTNGRDCLLFGTTA